jgi:hypothetical protein|tara:strand:+ start:297 stop:449 length:153 start_codon:yes stop_codon:yes gene_type:complete
VVVEMVEMFLPKSIEDKNHHIAPPLLNPKTGNSPEKVFFQNISTISTTLL